MHTTESRTGTERRIGEAAKDFGYMVAVVVNLGLVYVVNHLLEWGWPSFLTADFEKVLPIINLSLGASILFNLVYIFFDRRSFKASTQAVANVVGLWGAILMWKVFPFDFSNYSGFDWEMLARFVIGVAIFGTIVGTIAETGKALKAFATGN